MTSKHEKPEVETDTTQDKAETQPTPSGKVTPASESPSQQPEKNGASNGTKLGTIAIITAIILSGAAAGYAYKMNQAYLATINTLDNQLSQSNAQISALRTELNSKTDALKNRTDVELGQQQKSLESLQLAFAELKGRRPNDWLLAESDYLVKLSGRKLFLERDVVSATHLMESADQRIAALNDPSLVPLRKAMADDITTLKAVPLIDKDGLVLRLTSLQQKIDDLPLANAILPEVIKTEKAVVSEDISNWKENLLTSLKDFSENFVTFRTRDGNAIPLLSPEQHFYLRENIKSQLATAIKAVYNEEQTLYTTGLNTALTWSQNYFNQDNNEVAQFNQTIEQLAKQNVHVTYPVKLSAQALLSDVINDRLRREVTGLIKESN